MNEMNERNEKQNQTNEIVSVIPMTQIVANRYQPRTHFDAEDLSELSDSIARHGMLQPILLREVTDGMYEIIVGERRFRAAKLAGLTEIDAIIKDTSPTDAAVLALVENIQRKDLSAIEEARSYEQVMSLYARTQHEIAQMVGISQSALANKLRLLQLTDVVQKGIEQKTITERHGRALLKVKDPEVQVSIYDWIVEKQLTVKETEKYIERYFHNEALKESNGTTFLHIAKDTKLAVNTINKAVKTIQDFGMDVEYSTNETETQYVLEIIVPKNMVETVESSVTLPHEKNRALQQHPNDPIQSMNGEQHSFRPRGPQQESILKDTTKSMILDLDLTSETVFFKPEEDKIEISDDEL